MHRIFRAKNSHETWEKQKKTHINYWWLILITKKWHKFMLNCSFLRFNRKLPQFFFLFVFVGTLTKMYYLWLEFLNKIVIWDGLPLAPGKRAKYFMKEKSWEFLDQQCKTPRLLSSNLIFSGRFFYSLYDQMILPW